MARPSPIAVAVLLVLVAVGANGAEPLFPDPLHLTREIQDGITGRTTIVEEYFFGDRAISIAESVTAIVDYAKGESIRIDRANGTWSVVTFDALARAARGRSAKSVAGKVEGWTVHAAGSTRRGTKNVSIYRATQAADGAGPRVELEIAVDHDVALTRAGAEAIAGAAWPNERSPESVAILRAAGGEGHVAGSAGATSAASDRVGLPLEVTILWRDGGGEVRLVNRIVRVGSERPPPGSMEIARGSRRIDDPRIASAALLEALEGSQPPRD